jgi:hypothetical protein
MRRAINQALGAAVAVATLAGCGSGTDVGASDPVDIVSAAPNEVATSAPGEAVPVDSEAAGRALAAAVAIMRDEQATRFSVEMKVAEASIGTISGIAMAPPVGWRATAEIFDLQLPGTEPYVMHVRSTKGRMWMQMEKWPAKLRGCWLSLEPTQAPLGFTALLPDEPMYLGMPAMLQARGFTDETRTAISADLDLVAALSLLTLQGIDSFDLQPSMLEGRTVPALARLVDARITELSLSGRDIFAVLQTMGARIEKAAESFLRGSTFRLTYADGGTGALIRPPAADLVTKDEKGCHSR